MCLYMHCTGFWQVSSRLESNAFLTHYICLLIVLLFIFETSCDASRSCRSQKKASWRLEATRQLLQRRRSPTLQRHATRLMQVWAAGCSTDPEWWILDLCHPDHGFLEFDLEHIYIYIRAEHVNALILR